MCKILNYNDFACLMRCPNGCCLHLYFGNVALRLQPADITDWQSDLAILYRLHAPHVTDPQHRCLTLPGLSLSQAFVFTLEEVFLLRDLLTGAALLLEVEQILAAAQYR